MARPVKRVDELTFVAGDRAWWARASRLSSARSMDQDRQRRPGCLSRHALAEAAGTTRPARGHPYHPPARRPGLRSCRADRQGNGPGGLRAIRRDVSPPGDPACGQRPPRGNPQGGNSDALQVGRGGSQGNRLEPPDQGGDGRIAPAIPPRKTPPSALERRSDRQVSLLSFWNNERPIAVLGCAAIRKATTAPAFPAPTFPASPLHPRAGGAEALHVHFNGEAILGARQVQRRRPRKTT